MPPNKCLITLNLSESFHCTVWFIQDFCGTPCVRYFMLFFKVIRQCFENLNSAEYLLFPGATLERLMSYISQLAIEFWHNSFLVSHVSITWI